ncbi:MAG: MafI family immunity protein [Pseudomonadota bacterium]
MIQLSNNLSKPCGVSDKMISSTKEQQEREQRTVALLKRFENSLPPDRIETCYSLATHLESVVALEILLDNLYEFDVTPMPKELEEIKTLCGDLGVDKKFWRHW